MSVVSADINRKNLPLLACGRIRAYAWRCDGKHDEAVRRDYALLWRCNYGLAQRKDFKGRSKSGGVCSLQLAANCVEPSIATKRSSRIGPSCRQISAAGPAVGVWVVYAH